MYNTWFGVRGIMGVSLEGKGIGVMVGKRGVGVLGLGGRWC